MSVGSEKQDGGALEVSVVIPTRNRKELLRDVIESIWGGTMPPDRYEIIVVDNQSTDGTPEMVAEMQRESPCRLRFHVMAENRGPASSRNHGVQMAESGLIAFTDSDCRAHPRWLELGTEAMRDPEVAFCNGSVLDKPEQPIKFFTRTNSGVTEEHPTYPTCNAFYRRDLFLKYGSFDEALCFKDIFNRVSECADVDLAWKIKKAGHRNAFVRDMIIYHEVDVLSPWNWMRDPFRLYIVCLIVKRHPELRALLLKWKLFFNRENILVYLATIGLILALVFMKWQFLLLAVPVLVWGMLAGGGRITPGRLHKLLPRAALLTARQAFICAGLIYGSIRFRSLVL